VKLFTSSSSWVWAMTSFLGSRFILGSRDPDRAYGREKADA
jgi:hypothetical protein